MAMNRTLEQQWALRRMLVFGMGRTMMQICDVLTAYFKHKRRKMWVRGFIKHKKQYGEYHTLSREIALIDHETYFQCFRMTPMALEDLLLRVGPRLEKKLTFWREPLSAKHRLCITLRYLATGDSMKVISFSYRIGHSTVSLIVKETSKAIWEILQPSHLPIPSESDLLRLAAEFNSYWNFPHCVGALDGKHVAIQAPNTPSKSQHFNCKGFHSRVLMAMCDARYRLTMIDVGIPGKHNDNATFQASPFGQEFENGMLQFPQDSPLSGRVENCPYIIVADETFPLCRYLMTPYPGTQHNLWRQIFNNKLSRARRTIENTFGILANRWRVFRRAIIAKEDTVDDIIRACCCLHNFVMDSLGDVYNPEGYVDSIDAQGNAIHGKWRTEGTVLPDIKMTTSEYVEAIPQQIRDVFTMYFMSSEVEVPWQFEHANLHL